MKKTPQVYLSDILKAIENIQKFSSDNAFDDFVSDEMAFHATLYNLEVIGEAANMIEESFFKEFPYLNLIPAIEMRNILIHGYDQVDAKIVWDTIQNNLPALKKKILEILKNFP